MKEDDICGASSKRGRDINDRWIKIDQLMLLALFSAQHVSNASTLIFRSFRLCVGVLLWFDVCWRHGVVRLG